MKKYVPRGPAWNRRSLIMPGDAQPFTFAGRSTTAAAGKANMTKMVEHTVPVTVNGARIAVIRSAGSQVTHHLLVQRNGGELADLSLHHTNNLAIPLGVFFVFEPNDTWSLWRYSESGADTGGAVAEGWYF